ncbi:SOS response-associated peptidase [Allosalinactinospora lopnorensis]|uniref:SOS response-associated peptidase n=1 Tax=Allosalinactinospora lopnorensis TaxID=1352348 RepID=UPI000623C1CC|nr:SOS response-associated peptidase [Allosalinactinospora lopnorensis]
MCGRYVSARNDHQLQLSFDTDERVGEHLAPSWNIAPTQTVRVILEEAEDGGTVRRLRNVRWGLLPVWAKDRKAASRMINARSETVTEKPAFRSAAAKRRCVVPADGYYEWQRNNGGKVPYYLHPDDESVLAFAGLYELWPDPDVAEEDPAKWVWTCTILTRPATDALGHVHDRCPVILPHDMVGDWLAKSTTDKGEVRRLIDAIPDPSLVPRPVGRAVGSPRNNHPGLTEEVAA